jgi:two-component system chemotaxis response regulator CheV
MSHTTNILLEAGTNELEIVEFYLEENPKERDEGEKSYRGYYGVNVAKVLEIIRMPKITDMPDVSNAAVLGAFNLREKIIPLVDLAKWLRKDRIELESPKVIVTEFNDTTTAFMVSGVTRIHRISWESVEAPTNYVSSLSANSITGVVKLENRIVFILDLEKIVSDLNPESALRLDDNIVWTNTINNRALIADDSPLIRGLLRDLMQRARFLAETTSNGRECWDRLQAIKQQAEDDGRPLTDYLNVIVADIEMPMMDGLTLTKRIKEDPAFRKIPVVLFSSIITDKLRHKGESVGADDQISKPEVTQLAQRAVKLIKQMQGVEPQLVGEEG